MNQRINAEFPLRVSIPASTMNDMHFKSEQARLR